MNIYGMMRVDWHLGLTFFVIDLLSKDNGFLKLSESFLCRHWTKQKLCEYYKDEGSTAYVTGYGMLYDQNAECMTSKNIF